MYTSTLIWCTKRNNSVSDLALAFESGIVGGELLGDILQPPAVPLTGLVAVVLHGDVLIRPGRGLRVHRERLYRLCTLDDDVCTGVIYRSSDENCY